MSRSGYTDDMDDQWAQIMWRGAVKSAIRGKRGQALLKGMLAALDSLAERRLIAKELEAGGSVCALGALGKARGLDMHEIDPEDYERVAGTFGIATALVQEIMYMNDEGGLYGETPEARYARMRRWVEGHIKQ